MRKEPWVSEGVEGLVAEMRPTAPGAAADRAAEAGVSLASDEGGTVAILCYRNAAGPAFQLYGMDLLLESAD